MPAHIPRTFTGLAGGTIRRAMYNGVEHIVVPVVCALGNMVVWPLNATGWELVPEEELAAYPTGWNGRPILPDHPHGGTLSANDPDTLARLQFGTMFATRYANGALQTEAWLNPLRAKEVGPAAESVIERVLSGVLVEVSVGAGIITDPTPGVTSDGREYSAIWRDIIPDHLAMLPRGAEGACSVEMGCGAPRQLALSAMSQLRAAQAAILSAGSIGDAGGSDGGSVEPRACAPLSKARRPTYFGTEDTAWSSPSFADYAKALHSGDEGTMPKSVAECSMDMKRDMAVHTLLGNPDADNLRDLTMLPCVDPRNGKLNKRALLSIIGARGTQANILSASRKSAQDMARSLLKKEFGVEESKMKSASGIVQHMLRAIGIRDAQADTSSTSDVDLREALQSALRATEPGFVCIDEVYPDTSTVVYMCYPAEEPLCYQRTYTAVDDGTVKLNNDRELVEMRIVYEPVAATASDTTTPPCSCQTNVTANSGASSATATGDTAQEDVMNKDALKAAVARLHRGAATDEDKALLTAELGMTPEELAPAAPATTTPAVVAPAVPVAAAAGTPAPIVTPAAAAAPKSPEDLEREWLATSPPPHLVAMADRFKAEEATRRAQLVAAISGATSAYTAEELAAMPTSGGPGSLERTYVALGLGATAFPGTGPSFLGRPFPAPAPGAGSVEVKRRRYEGPMAAAARSRAGGAAPTSATADPDDVAN